MRFALLVLAIAALAVVCAMPASAAKGGTDRPYKASGSLTGNVDLVNFPFAWDVKGPSISSHLGNAPSEVAGNLVSPNFAVTITAANGDKLYGAWLTDLPATGTCPAGSDPFHNLQSWTGGTGRFTNATGTVDVKGCNSIDFITGTFVITFTSTGTISY
jgi:hypothetical protein